MTTAPLDFDTCYSAVASFDSRFDGQFITAVRSTGIYCRPSCPARTPKRANCTFYRTSAAAHAAGYRACKRCLPEAVPGSPEWNLREDAAARAMRLIADGVVDREGVRGLAARLGYSERQLSRILSEELGASPLQLARAQRAQNARNLLVSTELPVSEVAFASGFASIRQFNDTIGEVFAMAPTELRSRARTSTTRNVRTVNRPLSGAITLRLRTREPFNGADVVRWLAKRAVAGLELVETHPDGEIEYTRSVRLAKGAAVMTVRADPAAVSLTARLEHLDDLPSLIARTRRLFDLDADPDAIDSALARDPRIAPSVGAYPGTRIPGSMGGTEMAMRAIVGQQVSVAAARTAVEGLVAALGEPMPDALAGHGVDLAFPTADALAAQATQVLRGPLARRETAARVAAAIAEGTLSVDIAQTRAELTGSLEGIRGIGPWTSNYLALRLLGSPDLLLTGDSAVRSGAARLGLPAEPRALADAGTAFAPWRSYLMTHLWRAAAPPTPREALT
jgi:AraC family transcriptional regulator of adaptative response / DNA-3-methyladenine glycosylase II